MDEMRPGPSSKAQTKAQATAGMVHPIRIVERHPAARTGNNSYSHETWLHQLDPTHGPKIPIGRDIVPIRNRWEVQSLDRGSDYEASLEWAREKDAADSLSRFREEFYLPPGRIYLDGNSLGLLSKRAEQAILEALEVWKRYGIDGWTEGLAPWFYLEDRVAELVAPLLGIGPDAVVVSSSTTVNIHQTIATFYRPQGRRNKIVADALTFPSDIYALQSQIQLQGYDPAACLIRVAGHPATGLLEEEDLIRAMADDVALVFLPSVLYRTGQIIDMKRLTAAAHERGIVIGFDCCHSVGAIPHALDEWDVDFAVWCQYKYLNGGPGAVAGLFINRRHRDRLPGLRGWFGSQKDKQFDMEHTFTPAPGAKAFQLGTPHVLSMAPLVGALDMFRDAGIHRVREKSLELTRYLMLLATHHLQGLGFMIKTPTCDDRRGGHVLLQHPEAIRITKALKAQGVIPDFRAPDGIRMAPIALYTSFEEVYKAIDILRQVMVDGTYKRYSNNRQVVS